MPRRRQNRSSSRPPSRRRMRKRSRARFAFFLIFSLLILSVALFMNIVDKRLLPTVIKIEEYRIHSKLNQAIDSSIKALSGDGILVSSDFYHISTDFNGKIISLAANTILINEVCANLSHFIDTILTNQDNDYIEVPVGALLGIEWLANIGPSYRISVMPIGASGVDYETSFTSVGINQINFQVWLTISTKMQIINPLQVHEVNVSRRIPLVNTVFSGDIPSMYLTTPPARE